MIRYFVILNRYRWTQSVYKELLEKFNCAPNGYNIFELILVLNSFLLTTIKLYRLFERVLTASQLSQFHTSVDKTVSINDNASKKGLD